jgi:putative NADH-flavin reductase
MQVLILGATGRTGRELLKQALGHGHRVRVMARDPERVTTVHPHLEVIGGDIRSVTALAAAAKGRDAVLSAVGVNDRTPNTVLSEGVRNLVRAMMREKVPRLLFVSSLGVGDSKWQPGPLYGWVLRPTLLKHVFADRERAEALIRESKLRWTLVRPGVLRNTPLTGTYRCGPDAARRRLAPHVGRADVADFMLRALERDHYVNEAAAICY